MAEKLYYSMGEVAEMFDVKRSLIRHWESQFSVLKPRRTAHGNRMFTPRDVEHLKVIYHLVKERGMTLEGAKRAMKRQAADGPDGEMKREAELMARLKHIRALLVEVREDLKSGGEGIIADDEPMAEPEEAPRKAGAPVSRRTKPVVKIEPAEESAEEPVEERFAAAESAAEEAAAEQAVAPAMTVEEELDAEPIAMAAVSEQPAVEAPELAEEAAASKTEEPAEPTGSGPEEPVATAEPVFVREAAEPAIATTAEPAPSEPESAAEESDVADAPAAGTPDPGAAKPKPRSGAPRRPRRKSNDDENKELFAFYEQSLF
ncbi:MAG: MerR family transcriptional regulator [Alistipes sp.]|nr:MerR family transcriptional regulator [Alistipes sp.]